MFCLKYAAISEYCRGRVHDQQDRGRHIHNERPELGTQHLMEFRRNLSITRQRREAKSKAIRATLTLRSSHSAQSTEDRKRRAKRQTRRFVPNSRVKDTRVRRDTRARIIREHGIPNTVRGGYQSRRFDGSRARITATDSARRVELHC